MKWFIKALKQYADFNGRARRKEYWLFVLFYIIFFIMLTIIDVVLGLFDPMTGFGPFSAVFWVGTIIPSISVSIRRLHDAGFSGWWYLLNLTIIGIIPVLIMHLMDSKPDNAYGSNPKSDSVDVAPQAA